MLRGKNLAVFSKLARKMKKISDIPIRSFCTVGRKKKERKKNQAKQWRDRKGERKKEKESGRVEAQKYYFSSLTSLLCSKSHTTFTKYRGMKTFPSVHYKIVTSTYGTVELLQDWATAKSIGHFLHCHFSPP